MYLSVKQVEPQNDYKLLLTFENNERRLFDVSPYLNTGMFKDLKDESMFRTVKVSFDTIEWDNEVDFDPEILCSLSIKL